jgi:quercetin dioxygenase-like cupin family protein
MSTPTFHDEWVSRSRDNEERVAASPLLARGADLDWVETPHDARVAVVIGMASGFPTQGTSLLQAEIPPGWHTGRHVHGEEAIFVRSGSGFAVIGERRYDFRPGTTIHVPYMAPHQLVNTGEQAVTYLSATTIDLDLFVRLGRYEQLSDKGAGNDALAARYPAEESQFAPDGRRIALHQEDMIDEYARRREEARVHGHHHGATGHTHGAIWVLMGGSESPSTATNGFRASAVAMTNIFEEVPHSSSHRHSHTEAVLYALDGSGYSEIDGARYDWVAGDAVYVPPRMTVHEHFNESSSRTRTLRIEFGIRYFYEALWEGYHKIELREEAMAR